jgi:hypothetical protein
MSDSFKAAPALGPNLSSRTARVRAVIAELTSFQNPDGGFAARLESDHRWQGSTATATMIAPTTFYSGLESDVAVNLDYIIKVQQPDGGWDPNWSWSEVNASAWQAALKEIRASLTLQNLRKLQAFHRIEGRLASTSSLISSALRAPANSVPGDSPAKRRTSRVMCA